MKPCRLIDSSSLQRFSCKKALLPLDFFQVADHLDLFTRATLDKKRGKKTSHARAGRNVCTPPQFTLTVKSGLRSVKSHNSRGCASIFLDLFVMKKADNLIQATETFMWLYKPVENRQITTHKHSH